MNYKDKIALFPGSFNPMHLGHISLIRKATKYFKKIVVCISINENKTYTNSIESRKQQVIEFLIQNKLNSLINDVVINLNNTIQYCLDNKINYIIRGYRNKIDKQYELNLKRQYKKQNKRIKFILFKSNKPSISSSSLRANSKLKPQP